MLAESLSRVRTRMEQLLRTDSSEIDRIMLHPMQRAGKEIRPRLVLLSAGLFGPLPDEAIDVAVAAECIHTASLIHDDILDDAMIRRGIPSAGSLFGVKAGVLVGDHYFAAAYYCLARLGRSEIVGDFSRAIRDMCFGEISQDLHLFDADMEPALYYRHIHGKTASLFGAACRCGALAGGAAGQDAEKLGRFGEAVGFAYQICDDVWDVAGSEEQLGKPVGGDLKNGVMTLPVIRAIRSAEEGPWLREMFRSRCVSETALPRSLAGLHACGAVNAAVQESKAYLERALEELAPFRSHPGWHELKGFAEGLVRLPENLSGPIIEGANRCVEPAMALSCPVT